jgi:hypothetical protein
MPLSSLESWSDAVIVLIWKMLLIDSPRKFVIWYKIFPKILDFLFLERYDKTIQIEYKILNYNEFRYLNTFSFNLSDQLFLRELSINYDIPVRSKVITNLRNVSKGVKKINKNDWLKNRKINNAFYHSISFLTHSVDVSLKDNNNKISNCSTDVHSKKIF